MKFSNLLKKLRKEYNLSQKALAEKLCTTQSAISMWESEVRNPPLKKALELCDIFGIEHEEIVYSFLC